MSKQKTIIVKVQAAQHPYHADFMTYNKERDIHFISPFDQKFFDDMMQGEEKAYFIAVKKQVGKTEAIEITERTDEQDW